jgi:hypothetical protein
VLLQWCYSVVTVILQWFHSGVEALQWCYSDAVVVLHLWNSGITSMSPNAADSYAQASLLHIHTHTHTHKHKVHTHTHTHTHSHTHLVCHQMLQVVTHKHLSFCGRSSSQVIENLFASECVCVCVCVCVCECVSAGNLATTVTLR